MKAFKMSGKVCRETTESQKEAGQLVTGAELFDFAQIRLERVVDPGDYVMTTEIIGGHAGIVNIDGHG